MKDEHEKKDEAKLSFRIGALLSEAVIRILEHVMYQQGEGQTIDDLRRLTLISKNFLSVMRSTPTLWAAVKYSGRGLTLPLLAPRKSKEASITGFIGDEDAGEGVTKKTLQKQRRSSLPSFNNHTDGVWLPFTLSTPQLSYLPRVTCTSRYYKHPSYANTTKHGKGAALFTSRTRRVYKI